MSYAELRIDDSDRNGRYRIGWYFVDEGEFGLMLGDDQYTESDLSKTEDKDVRECAMAYLAALKTEGVNNYECSMWWDTKSQATKALRVIKAAVANIDHPWPEWAVKARAEGWTPPKGWKP